MVNPHEKALAQLVGEQYIDGMPADDTRNYTGEENVAEEVQEEADEGVNENEPEEDVQDDPERKGEEDDDDDEREEEDEPEEDKGERKPRSRFQRRIDALTADMRRLERELKAEKASKAVPKNADGTPMSAGQWARSQLKTDAKAPKAPDEYAKDKDGKLIFPLGQFDRAYKDALYEFEQERDEYVAAKTAEFNAQASATTKAAPASVPDDFVERLEAFKGDDKGVKGFKEAVKAAEAQEWPLSLTIAQLIVESEVGREIATHLHQNPKLAEEIAALPDYKQAARFGKLEDKIAAQKVAARTATPTNAPKPTSKVRGRSTDTKVGYNSNDFEAVERRWNTENRPRRA